MSCTEENTIPMKVGDTVRFNCLFKDSDGNPKSLAGYRIDVDFIHPRWGRVILSTNSADEDGGIVIHQYFPPDLPYNPDPPTNPSDPIIVPPIFLNLGEYTIHGGSSSEWPEGLMPVDILYSKNGDQIHTEDFYLNFTKGRSRIVDAR